MNLKRLLVLSFVLSLLSAVAFGLTAFLVSENQITRFDHAVISFIQGFEYPAWTRAMTFFTWMGSGIVVTVLSFFIIVIFIKLLKHRSEFILFITVIAGSALLNQILKSLFHRARPSLHLLIQAGGFSFPSGHTMEAVAFYGILAFLLWRHLQSRWARGMLLSVSIIVILLVGISRIYLGVHYPSDVIGGYFASGCWLASAIWVYQLYREKRWMNIKNHYITNRPDEI